MTNNTERPLISLAHETRFKNITQFLAASKDVLSNIDKLADAYQADREIAGAVGARKEYRSTSRRGQGGSPEGSNRTEERLAMAFFNRGVVGLRAKPDQQLHILDYQLPLKTSNRDIGVGKVDLLGSLAGRLAAIELKVPSRSSKVGAESASEAPPRAMLEGLAYCAILEAHYEAVRSEYSQERVLDDTHHKPSLVILAPRQYWDFYLQHSRAGEWVPTLEELARRIEDHPRMGVPIHFLSVEGIVGWSSTEGLPENAHLVTALHDKR